MDINYEEIDKFSNNLERGDEIRVAGLLCKIIHISIDYMDDLVLHFEIIGATKKQSKGRLVLPKGVPVTTLK